MPDPGPDDLDAEPSVEDEHQDPKGTLTLLLLFLLLIAALWIWAYFSLIARG